LLYYKGNKSLNEGRFISIIGTRNNTSYGKNVTENFVAALQAHDVTIVSGLAFGIDAIAHKAALQNKLPTLGVLAHGLHTIYPGEHAQIAREIIETGGLLTEFTSRCHADKHNFPRRNRIVAGISDATIVIETAARGGSMITAEYAYSYNRDVFACPGKISDSKSEGCNMLIRQNKAILLTDAQQLLEIMGWQSAPRQSTIQKQLFVDLSTNEKNIVDLLSSQSCLHIDEINFKSNLNNSLVAAAILNLELAGIVQSLPGKMYRLA
jgi:DNA processing protein